MQNFTWDELALADEKATSVMIDCNDVRSHKVLTADEKSCNSQLVSRLTKEYTASLNDFDFVPVNYLPQTSHTNLGIFAKRDLEEGSDLHLMGFLADITAIEDLPEGINVSVFQRKQEQLMLGPLSFVNHSCWPNAVYVFRNELMSLKLLRKVYAGEEITVNYGPR